MHEVMTESHSHLFHRVRGLFAQDEWKHLLFWFKAVNVNTEGFGGYLNGLKPVLHHGMSHEGMIHGFVETCLLCSCLDEVILTELGAGNEDGQTDGEVP